ncbi:unnamed protein product [Rotaria socialis]|uniref:Tetraspanin n=1 Tax=Rotaria socialis TaxID=392032 RepID=A0A820HNJ6_9BILA|nr:unnamed protein product [Rotaria socialis]CAF4375299.1 unnamed protein product [Rotaria socialis]CAF4622708.1 unnamed protein product [Rotaria socialis]
MQNAINSTFKTIAGENHDSYRFPLESGKAIALTMNFPQHHSSVSNMAVSENNQVQDQLINQHLHSNHITTDPHGCLDCMSTMFGPNYAPFAAFMLHVAVHQFSEFAQTQKTIAMKQNGLIENLVSLHQREHPTKQILNEEELQHVFTYGSWSNGKRLFSSNPHLIILVLIAVGVLYVIAVVAYFSGFIGHSKLVTMIAVIFNMVGTMILVIIVCIVLFMGDRMRPNFAILLEQNVENFESDSSTNSLSYSWTVMHIKYNCCVDGILQTGQTVGQKSPTFASIHPGWSIPESCCFTDKTVCVQSPTVNNSFINSSCVEPAARHFNQLLSTFNFILLPNTFIAMICNACGIFYLMRLKTAIDRMNLSNSELAKSLFALKSKHLAGIRSDIKKNPIAEFQREKNDQMNGKKQHLNIPGYFPITPTILQVRQPEQTTYLDYGL